jgi:Uncharacterized protein conserved in bacteria (DUF2188)
VPEGFVHTVPVNAHWENTIEGQDGMFGGPYNTKTEAVTAGRAEAQRRNTQHVIHGKNGSIELVWRQPGTGREAHDPARRRDDYRTTDSQSDSRVDKHATKDESVLEKAKALSRRSSKPQRARTMTKERQTRDWATAR